MDRFYLKKSNDLLDLYTYDEVEAVSRGLPQWMQDSVTVGIISDHYKIRPSEVLAQWTTQDWRIYKVYNRYLSHYAGNKK